MTAGEQVRVNFGFTPVLVSGAGGVTVPVSKSKPVPVQKSAREIALETEVRKLRAEVAVYKTLAADMAKAAREALELAGVKLPVRTTGVMKQADVPAFIRQRRGAAGLTQKALAKSAGLSEKSVVAYESGESLPNAGSAYRLAMVLDLDQDERDAFAKALRSK